jgi:predicted phosphodiesterase
MEIARILVEGDAHLSSKNRGAHRDYPNESLKYFNYVSELAKNYGCTHIVNLGDLTYGRFGTLEYRNLVDEAFRVRNEICNNNFYVIKGNHDSATYGQTEYEYYLNKGVFKGAENLVLGNCNINMVNFGEQDTAPINVDDEHTNIVLTHGYFKFKSTELPPYGEPVILDEFEKWFGVNNIICGHIHKEHIFEGNMIKGDRAVKTTVHYLPCLSRPSYEADMPTVGAVDIIRVFDDSEPIITRVEIPLLPIEESFNLEQKVSETEHKERVSVDVSDIVKELSDFERVGGDPDNVIRNMEEVDIRYRNRALELLKEAEA